MMSVICLSEQQTLPAIAVLRRSAEVQLCSWEEVVHHGWERPLVLLGLPSEGADVRALFQRVAQNPAPVLFLPPLPRGDIASLLDAPAPVIVVRQQAEVARVMDEHLEQALGRSTFHVYCTEGIETALQSGVLVTAQEKPVIWTYRRTRTATPVVVVAIQLLMISARSDAVDREELLLALLGWAEAQVGTGLSERGVQAQAPAVEPDPGLLRALAVALTVRPDLSYEALSGWLWERLHVLVHEAELRIALEMLQARGVLDANGRPHVERLAVFVEELNLRAWVREARREEQGR